MSRASDLSAVAPPMNAKDADAIAFVRTLRHRVGRVRNCRCEDCRLLTHAVALMGEAVAMKAARRHERQTPRRPRQAPFPGRPYSCYGETFR